MSAWRYFAAAAKTTPRGGGAPCPNYQAVVDKVERLKTALVQVDSLSISKSIQGLESRAKSHHVVWNFNARKVEHGLHREEPEVRRSYHLALGITSLVMYLAPKVSKMFT